MGKSLSNRCSHVLLLLCADVLLLLCAGLSSGKQLPIQEVPASGLSPEALSTLPLEVPQRVALEQAYKSRNYPRAETLLVAEIERNPKSADMLTVLGTIFFLDGKYLNCAIAMKKAEAISPLPDQNRFILALSYIILGRRDWARPELERLARLNQRDARYPYWLGRLDYDAMQFNAAVSHLQTAIELDPTYMKAYDNLGLAFEGLGQYDVEWSPFLRQPVKTQKSANGMKMPSKGDLSHGLVSTAIHEGVQAGRSPAAGDGGLAGGGGAGI